MVLIVVSAEVGDAHALLLQLVNPLGYGPQIEGRSRGLDYRKVRANKYQCRAERHA